METFVPTSCGCMIPAPTDTSAFAAGFEHALYRMITFQSGRVTTAGDLLVSLESDFEYAADEDYLNEQWEQAQPFFTEQMLQQALEHDDYRHSEELARVYLITLCNSGADLQAIRSEVHAVLAERK